MRAGEGTGVPVNCLRSGVRGWPAGRGCARALAGAGGVAGPGPAGPGVYRGGWRREVASLRVGLWRRREKLSLGLGACDELVVWGGDEVTGRWAVPGRRERGRGEKSKAALPFSLGLAGSANPVYVNVDMFLL